MKTLAEMKDEYILRRAYKKNNRKTEGISKIDYTEIDWVT